MPASLRNFLLSFLPASALLVVILPTAAALVVSHWAGMQRQQEIATMMARQVLQRTDTISKEMMAANARFSQLARQDSCSPKSIKLMRMALLHTDTLADVGFIRNNRLVCSAFGLQDTPVGPPTYTSHAGYHIRSGLRLPAANDIRLVAATDPRTNITLLVHDAMAMDAVPTDSPWLAAVVGDGPIRAVLASRGQFDPDWLRYATGGGTGSFISKSAIVVWLHSNVGAYTIFVAMPPEMWQPALRKSSLLALALGLPISVLLAFALRRMANRNTTIRYLLRQALKHGELSLAYQPIVELTSGRWVGAEALMRWKRPRGEIIPPDVFIPIAEKSGLMPTIREYLIHTLEREAPALFQQHPDFHVALNFCAEDFCASEFPMRLKAAIERIGARPQNVQLEVTERVFMHLENACPSIDSLQKLGVAVAIDDFGTGFSSLSYLTRLKFDSLKIDKSFVNTIETGAVTSKIVNHIIEMAKSLDISMIAEGVETEIQAEYLRTRGVQYAQGWLYAKAMPMAELLEQLNHSSRSVQQRKTH